MLAEHPGIPCPREMHDRTLAILHGVGYLPGTSEKRQIMELACGAYYEAYLYQRLMCPVRYEARQPHMRCQQCGKLDHYERLIPAWVSLRSEGDPDDEREVNTEIVEDTATIRCLSCGVDDCFDELPRPPAALPDWSVRAEHANAD